jgi:hypothetical protein
MVLDDGPDIDPLDGPSRAGIQITLFPEVSAREPFNLEVGGISIRAWTWSPPLQRTIGPDALSRLWTGRSMAPIRTGSSSVEAVLGFLWTLVRRVE